MNVGGPLHPYPGADIRIQEPMGIRRTRLEQINLGESSVLQKIVGQEVIKHLSSTIT